MAREARQDFGLEKTDTLIPGHRQRESFFDQRRQDFGRSVERSVIHHRNVVDHGEVVAREGLDDVGLVADDGRGAKEHWTQGVRRIGLCRARAGARHARRRHCQAPRRRG